MTPRLLTKSQVAEYCGISLSGVSNWIVKGKLPCPLPGTRKWDRVAIDQSLDKLSKISPIESDESSKEDDFTKWRRENGHAH